MSQMKKPSVYLPCLFTILVLSAGANASSALRLSFEELITQSDRVVVAAVQTEGLSAWGPDRRRIYTTFTFEVEEDLAGKGPKSLIILQPGGRVGRWSQRTSGYPTFRMGDRVLLFLEKTDFGHRVVGLSQGVFDFHQEGERERIHQRLEGLSFPGNSGEAFRLEQGEAFRRIRALWLKRRAR